MLSMTTTNSNAQSAIAPASPVGWTVSVAVVVVETIVETVVVDV